MRTLRVLPLAMAAALIAACGAEHQDLRAWVKDTERATPRGIEKLPEVKPYQPFVYSGFDIPDPFKPRKLSTGKDNAGALAAEVDRQNLRRKEPLEAFPLESLKLVGVMQQRRDTYAVIRAEKTLYPVRRGNYLGQNFGLITDITENEVRLKELVQDSTGEWSERVSTLQLQEEAEKGTKK